MLLPLLAKLHSKRRKLAWAVVIILIVASTVARGWLVIEYTLTECLGASDLSGVDEARGQTVLYNKPYVSVQTCLGASL